MCSTITITKERDFLEKLNGVIGNIQLGPTDLNCIFQTF